MLPIPPINLRSFFFLNFFRSMVSAGETKTPEMLGEMIMGCPWYMDDFKP